MKKDCEKKLIIVLVLDGLVVALRSYNHTL